MNKPTLESALDRWSQAVEARAPREDARRTAQCLTFNEIAGLSARLDVPGRQRAAELLESKRDHITACGWCTRVVAQVAVLMRERLAQGDAETLHTQAAGDWLREHTTLSALPSEAYFDSEGSLHIELEGITERRVKVALQIDGDSIEIGAADVVNGVLRLSRALREYGLYDRQIPRELLLLMPA